MSRHGENIRKRKDGRWEGRYYVLEPLSGRHISRSVYAKTYSEAKEKLMTAKMTALNAASKERHNAGLMFTRAAEEWLAIVEGSKKRATYIKYRFVYEKYLEKPLCGITVLQMDHSLLSQLFQTEAVKERSDSLSKSISCVLNQILTYVELHYQITVPRYSRPRQRGKGRPVKALNQEEQIKLLQCLYDGMDIYKLGIVVCISTGLRLGEICALKWEDVDLRGQVLRVNATVQRISVEGQSSRTALLEGEPKSIFSKREIPLSDEIIKLLASYQENRGKYVLNRNKPMEPRTYQNKFQGYLKRAGIQQKNFHILRHTFATNCINSGTDIKSLSEILGHSDVKITLNRYVHPTIETKRRHMNSLSVIYGQYLGQ